MKKYKLTEETQLAPNGETVYRIEALKNFTLINGNEVRKGDKGGWLTSEDRMSQDGRCWIYEECMMFDNSHRSGDSIGHGYSWQYENSHQFGNSHQFENSRQFGNSRQYGNTVDYGTTNDK